MDDISNHSDLLLPPQAALAAAKAEDAELGPWSTDVSVVGAGFVVTQQVGGFNATRLGRLLKAVDALLVTAFGDNAWHDGEVAPFFEALGSQKGGRAEVLVRQVPMRHTGTPRTWPPAAGSPLLLSPEIDRSCVCSEPPESSSVRPGASQGTAHQHGSSSRSPLFFVFQPFFCAPRRRCTQGA